MVNRDINGIVTRIRRRFSSASRYDLLLLVIPFALASATIVAEVTDVAPELAIVAGSTIALLALVDGLFLNPPKGLNGV